MLFDEDGNGEGLCVGDVFILTGTVSFQEFLQVCQRLKALSVACSQLHTNAGRFDIVVDSA